MDLKRVEIDLTEVGNFNSRLLQKADINIKVKSFLSRYLS